MRDIRNCTILKESAQRPAIRSKKPMKNMKAQFKTIEVKR